MRALLRDEDETETNLADIAGPDAIRQWVHEAAHFLPTQGPIEVFVHHNTLHVYEDLNFHEAVQAGLERFQGEPYLSETDYRRLYTGGRLRDKDLVAVIQEDLQARGNEDVAGLGTRTELRFAMLRHPLHVGPDAELRWVVAESDALEKFSRPTTEINRARILCAARKWLDDSLAAPSPENRLQGLVTKYGRSWDHWSNSKRESFALRLLWRVCLEGAKALAPTTRRREFVRPRDLLLRATGHDTDREVHEFLIRYCGAFLDQGYSDWLLPDRDLGFYESFLRLYATPMPSGQRWLRRLQQEVAGLQRDGLTAEDSIARSLEQFGIPAGQRSEFITQTLLSLGGWAGMVWQLETGIDWVVHSIPEGSLCGMLAVQLLLEKQVMIEVGQDHLGSSTAIHDILQQARSRVDGTRPLNVERRAFLLFQVAQMLGWTPLELLQLTPDQWHDLADEVEGFTEIQRRRVFQEAYERRYRHAALDALAVHSSRRKTLPRSWQDRPRFQIVTCIDDREESFRRHLEEVQPQCETFGAAGFFAIAMYYRGAGDGFYKPLCPAVITPDHYVSEDVGYTFEGIHKSRAELRRRLGLASHAFHTRSRSFVGGILAGVVGSLATVPLVTRVLLPRLTAQVRQSFGSFLQPPPVTSLQLERYAADPGPTNGHIGFSVDEMANIVQHLLQDIGLTRREDFSRLAIICGHGSSSLNNPHESAYCCGACAGKRGGPNARAFAQMANDWRVRAKVAAAGIEIPNDTVFVGAYHNTCDDAVVFYDLDRLPASHREEFESARADIEEARGRNAHERCRRFVSAPLNQGIKDALRHVEARAQDISQVRPEYNHATNALCLVGRRDWSRGLFLDRRAFLTSYDPSQDDESSSILARILAAAIPVCAGINLEYYFSCVDHANYGSGSKLPHNIVSLLGVMEGTSSDLRTGLYQQMVEIHEPFRITFVIETTRDAMLSIMQRNATIDRLVRGGWVHLAILDSTTSALQVYRGGDFQDYQPGDRGLVEASSSLECYQGSRDHLPFASIRETELPR